MQVCTLMKFIEFNLCNQLINVSIIIIVIAKGVYFNQIEFVSPEGGRVAALLSTHSSGTQGLLCCALLQNDEPKIYLSIFC